MLLLLTAILLGGTPADTSAVAPYPPVRVDKHWEYSQPVCATPREVAERSIARTDGQTLGRPYEVRTATEGFFLSYLDSPAESLLACADWTLWEFPVYRNGRPMRVLHVSASSGGYEGAGRSPVGEFSASVLAMRSRLKGGRDIAYLRTNLVGTYLVIHRNYIPVSVRPLDGAARRVLDPKARRAVRWGPKIGKPVGIYRASRLIKAALHEEREAKRRGQVGGALGPKVNVEIVWSPASNGCTELFVLATNPNSFDVYVPRGTSGSTVQRGGRIGYGCGVEREFPDLMLRDGRRSGILTGRTRCKVSAGKFTSARISEDRKQR